MVQVSIALIPSVPFSSQNSAVLIGWQGVRNDGVVLGKMFRVYLNFATDGSTFGRSAEDT